LIHVFMLVVLIADVQQPSPMYFRSIDVCQYYARRIPMQYGNYGSKWMVPEEHRITAYCKPMKMKAGPYIYDH
jgi:hypothetical protein